MYVVLVGVGLTGIEKFAHQSVSTDESPECCNANNQPTAFGEATDGAS